MADTQPALDDPSESVSPQPLLQTALIDAHRRLGAKLIGFGGWEMPLSYGQGTLAEHRACRQDAVVFDVSHLGTVRVEGAGAFDRLQDVLTNDLRRIGPGRAQYTHLLDDSDGSVVDDIIVWWLSEDVFDVMPNASNTERVEEAVGGTNTTRERCIIAVQGPHARARLAEVAPDAASVPRFRVVRFVWQGAECVAAGTGYTGEDGVECAVPADIAEAFWTALLGAGVAPAGLGARDTLRLEAALPLHGHELGPGITPLQAGLGWVVGWDKETFRGRTALADERKRGVARGLVGMTTTGRQPPRQGSRVVQNGGEAGTVTSGNYSPMLEHGIALALVDTSFDTEPSTSFEIDQRGRRIPADVVTTPFTHPGQFASGGPVAGG